jgi:hypothetical protein
MVAQEGATSDSGLAQPDAAAQAQPDAAVLDKPDAACMATMMDAAVMSDGESPVDTGTLPPMPGGFSPAALYAAGVSITYACTSSPFSWPVGDMTNPQPAPLPPMFSLSATVKIGANPAPLMKLDGAHALASRSACGRAPPQYQLPAMPRS